MCDRCIDIDATISRYQWIKTRITDSKAVQAATDLIAKLEAEKVNLHPEQKK
jgi:hypothetical protein